MALETLAAGAKILGGLAGLFKGGSKDTPHTNLLSQASGARAAAEQFGFNPLTMLQLGQAGGAAGGGGGAPPLASLQVLSDGFADLNDVSSGDADRRRKAAELQIALAERELENATISASPLGRRAVTTYQATARQASPKMAGSAAVVPTVAPMAGAFGAASTSALPQEDVPTPRSSDHIVMRSSLDGGDYAVPAVNGEPLDMGQAIIVGGSMASQMAYNSYQKYIGQPFVRAVDAVGSWIETPAPVKAPSGARPPRSAYTPKNPKPITGKYRKAE